MGSAAIDSGRQRQLLQTAQVLINDLRSLPLDQDTSTQNFSRIFELAQVVKRLIDTTTTIQHSETRAMWEQRGSWLQEEVAALAAERIQSSEPRQYWLNLLALLFVGADACSFHQRDKEAYSQKATELEHALHACHHQLEEMRTCLQTSQDNRRDAALTEEALELRSKLVVAQQELQKKAVDFRDMSQHMQAVVAERDALRLQLDELQKEHAELAERVDRQLEVIQTMMAKNEEWSGRMAGLVRDNASLQQHNTTLGSNLEVNSRVVEKLIEMNTELMDRLNSQAFRPAPLAPSPALPDGSGPPVVTGEAPAAATGVLGVLPVSSQRPADTALRPANGPQGAAAPEDLAGSRGEGGGRVVPRRSDGPSSKDSFTDAFEAFLKGDEPPPKATASSLAAPPTPPPPGPSHRGKPGESQGFLSRARFFISNLTGEEEEDTHGPGSELPKVAHHNQQQQQQPP